MADLDYAQMEEDEQMLADEAIAHEMLDEERRADEEEARATEALTRCVRERCSVSWPLLSCSADASPCHTPSLHMSRP
jgi:hypothetical protein